MCSMLMVALKGRCLLDTVAAFVKEMWRICTARLHIHSGTGISPHAGWHTRAMHLYQDGIPLAMVSEFLGHAQIETTKIYAHADTEMKRKAIQQAANKLNDTIPDALWNTDDEEMMLKLKRQTTIQVKILSKFFCRNPCLRVPG